MLQALSCFDRVQEYCNYQTTTSHEEDASIFGSSSDMNKGIATSEAIALDTKCSRHHISLPGNSSGWTCEGPNVLKDVRIDIAPGSVTAIVGPVGSGKSTLLQAILGETISASQQPSEPAIRSPVAYCAQKPWLPDVTIRDCIVGEAGLDPQWYKTVKTACDLDLDIERQSQGDMTRIGNGLSGGQRQRIVSRPSKPRSGGCF